MLKKLYDKSKVLFAVTWIIAYCVFMSLGDTFSEMIGIQKAITLPVSALLSVILFGFLKKNGLLRTYGFCRAHAVAREVLYYIPVLVMLTANLWYGVRFNYGMLEIVFYILSMLCVGFLEEVIFRGLLFEAMKKDSFKAAVTVSSLTFGIGHIINLINGSGATLLPNLLQVIYATAAGFMFVMLYCKTKSLIGCIAVHGIFNALGVLANEDISVQKQIITCVLLTVITGAYALYMAMTLKKEFGEKV